MKKWIVSLIAGGLLIFTFTTVVCAAEFGFDGRVRFKYVDFGTKDTNDQANKPDILDKTDTLINFKAKLTKELSFTAALKAQSTTKGEGIFFDEVYAKYEKSYGIFTIGDFLYSTTGDTAILTNVVDDLQTNFSISYQAPFQNGVIAKVYWGQGDEYADSAKNTNDGIYALTLGYTKENWGGDISVEESRLRAKTTKTINGDDGKKTEVTYQSNYFGTGLVLNAFYVPIKPLRLYANYEIRQQNTAVEKEADRKEYDYKDAILGVSYNPIEKLTLIGEYNFEDNDQDLNNWGARINYQLEKNILLALIRTRENYYDSSVDDFKSTNTTEFRIQINF